MLVKASIWLLETFEESSRPNVRTIKRWVETGKIIGTVINGVTYVERNQDISISQQAPIQSAKPVVDAEAQEWLRELGL